MRYGARTYAVHRFRDDRYKFLQTAEFETKLDFERYWHGPEFTDFRVLCSSWYQVPVLYSWADLVVEGTLEPEELRRRSGRAGVAGGEPAGAGALRRSATCARASARCPSACGPATGG